MIRLPMLNVDAGFACSFCNVWAALSAAPMHRRLTGDVPWQRDDVDHEGWTGLALWPEAEAQSGPIVGFADMTSHEPTTMNTLES